MTKIFEGFWDKNTYGVVPLVRKDDGSKSAEENRKEFRKSYGHIKTIDIAEGCVQLADELQEWVLVDENMTETTYNKDTYKIKIAGIISDSNKEAVWRNLGFLYEKLKLRKQWSTPLSEMVDNLKKLVGLYASAAENTDQADAAQEIQATVDKAVAEYETKMQETLKKLTKFSDGKDEDVTTKSEDDKQQLKTLIESLTALQSKPINAPVSTSISSPSGYTGGITYNMRDVAENIPKFQGGYDVNLEDYFFKIDSAMKRFNINNIKILEFVLPKLDGMALQLYIRLINNFSLRSKTLKWDDFKDKLVQELNVKDKDRTLRSELKHMKLNNFQNDFNKFVEKFLSISNRITPPYSEYDLIHTFIDALPMKIAEHVWLVSPKELSETIRIAKLRYEALVKLKDPTVAINFLNKKQIMATRDIIQMVIIITISLRIPINSKIIIIIIIIINKTIIIIIRKIIINHKIIKVMIKIIQIRIFPVIREITV